MSLRYAMRSQDGDDAGEVVLDQAPNPGDEIRVGYRLVLVRSVIPIERIEEFTGRVVRGILEVEPVDD